MGAGSADTHLNRIIRGVWWALGRAAQHDSALWSVRCDRTRSSEKRYGADRGRRGSEKGVR